MLKKQTESVQIMTIQNIDSLDAKNGETMQGISDKSNSPQQQTGTKNGHISFSVASLLADTRPSRPYSPQNSSITVPTSPQTHHSSDEEYDSNQEDSIVDVEDLNSDQKSDSPSPSKDSEQFMVQPREREFHRDGIMNQGPIRPTPFSALAAAVYQAAHPNWAHQGLVAPFGGPGPMFQGGAPFGVPNMTAGIEKFCNCSRTCRKVAVSDGIFIGCRIFSSRFLSSAF